MDNWQLWLTILAASLLTFGLRYSFIATGGAVKPPPLIRRALTYVPPAILSALVWPAVALRDGHLALSPDNDFLVATLIAAVAAWRTRNIFLTLVVGMGTLWLIRWLV